MRSVVQSTSILSMHLQSIYIDRGCSLQEKMAFSLLSSFI
jgi:hypothetical protein